MLGSVQLGVFQLGQGYADGVVEPPAPVEVEPDLVSVTAGVRTQVEVSAHLRSQVSLMADLCTGVQVAPAFVRSRVSLIAGIASVVHLQLER